jgi:hypothetical protein
VCPLNSIKLVESRRVTWPLLGLFNLFDDVVAGDDFAKDDVFTIEPRRRNDRDEELTSLLGLIDRTNLVRYIGISSSICLHVSPPRVQG